MVPKGSNSQEAPRRTGGFPTKKIPSQAFQSTGGSGWEEKRAVDGSEGFEGVAREASRARTEDSLERTSGAMGFSWSVRQK